MAEILVIQHMAFGNAIRKIEKSTEFSQNKTPILGAQTQPLQLTFVLPIQKHPSEDFQPLKSGPTTTPKIGGPWQFVGPKKRQNTVAKPI
jgi:hypothetical protein